MVKSTRRNAKANDPFSQGADASQATKPKTPCPTAWELRSEKLPVLQSTSPQTKVSPVGIGLRLRSKHNTVPSAYNV